MAAENDLEPGAATPSRAGKPPPSLGDVARRITSRTTDFIAIAIIVVASLTIGRQVLDWWHAPPTQAEALSEASGSRPAWEDSREPIALEFGDSPLAMTRQVVEGEKKTTIDVLVGHCRQAVSATRRPWRESDEAEERLLERTAGLTPVAEELGVWQVYVIDERFPMVAGVRRFASGQKEAARGTPRLVCWGMAMPAGKNVWNAYVFQGAARGSPAATGLPEVPLPPGSRRNLSLRDERGGALVGYSGSGSGQAWMKHYDGWFAAQGWSSNEGWRTEGGTWSARFRNQKDPAAGWVEIHFAEDAHRELTGLVQITMSGNTPK